MRKISTKKETKVYEIEIDGEIQTLPVRDYYDCPDISFMVMREINFINEKYRAIDPDYDGATLDFEQLISKAFIKASSITNEKEAVKIIKSVTTDVKVHALNCIGFMLDDGKKIFKDVSYADVLAVLRDVLAISQDLDSDEETTEEDKKKELLNTNDTTINSESADIVKERSKNGVYTNDFQK